MIEQLSPSTGLPIHDSFVKISINSRFKEDSSDNIHNNTWYVKRRGNWAKIL